VKPTLSIVLPSIKGREAWLDKAVGWYETNTGVPHELIVLLDYPGCGPAWQEGGERAIGSYIHFAADDLEPHKDWEIEAIQLCDRKKLPAPLVLHPDGRIQSCGGSWERTEADGIETEFARCPFSSRSQWNEIQPMIPTHYWTDNYFSERGRRAGYPTIVCHGYRLTHHSAAEGRNEQRMGQDHHIYERALAGEDVWASAS